MAQQQLTEEWFNYARRIWLTLKKANLYSEYDRIGEMHSELAANFQGAKVNIAGKSVYHD